jgi:hypothetical protein
VIKAKLVNTHCVLGAFRRRVGYARWEYTLPPPELSLSLVGWAYLKKRWWDDVEESYSILDEGLRIVNLKPVQLADLYKSRFSEEVRCRTASACGQIDPVRQRPVRLVREVRTVMTWILDLEVR